MLMMLLVVLILINYFIRSNLDLEIKSVNDVILLPLLITILFSLVVLGFKLIKKQK